MNWINHLFETWSWIESLTLSFLYLLVGAFRGWLMVKDIEKIVEEEIEELDPDDYEPEDIEEIQKIDREIREIQGDLKEQMEELEDLFGSRTRSVLIVLITLFWLLYDLLLVWDWIKSRFSK